MRNCVGKAFIISMACGTRKCLMLAVILLAAIPAFKAPILKADFEPVLPSDSSQPSRAARYIYVSVKEQCCWQRCLSTDQMGARGRNGQLHQVQVGCTELKLSSETGWYFVKSKKACSVARGMDRSQEAGGSLSRS